jgi:phenylacetate-CoA ligase
LDDLGPDQIEAAVRRILAARPRYMYGYSSMVLEFGAALAEVGGHRLKVAVVTTEYSRPYQRERLAGELGCPVVEEYGCSEVDIIAHQCPDGGYHIPAENMIVEVMPRDASDPLFGDIVVTDLNNHLMPLLRYRLGDEVRLSRVACPCGRSLPLLESVTGRTLYQYFHFPDGRRVHSYVFDYFIDELVASGVDVIRYQIRQRAADSIQILMVLGRDDPAVRAMVVANGRDRLQARLGLGIAVGFEFVQSISAPPGQKLEAFVPMRVE